MAASAQDYLNQITAMGAMPSNQSFQQQVTDAYNKPVLQPLVQERADLESQYLPALFEPFTKMGTGAGDMSPAAKLALVGESIGRLGGRIGANNNIQDFYGNQIGQVAQGLSQDWGNRNQNLWNLYNAQYQTEESARQRAAAAAQQTDWSRILSQLSNNQTQVGGGTSSGPITAANAALLGIKPASNTSMVNMPGAQQFGGATTLQNRPTDAFGNPINQFRTNTGLQFNTLSNGLKLRS